MAPTDGGANLEAKLEPLLASPTLGMASRLRLCMGNCMQSLNCHSYEDSSIVLAPTASGNSCPDHPKIRIYARQCCGWWYTKHSCEFCAVAQMRAAQSKEEEDEAELDGRHVTCSTPSRIPAKQVYSLFESSRDQQMSMSM